MEEIFSPLKQKQFFNWKGKSFAQVTSQIKKNAGLKAIYQDNASLFLPNPLKIYRRELNIGFPDCNPRTSASISIMEQPNGYSLFESNTTSVDGNYEIETIKSVLSSNTNNITQECNAKIRVRSSSGIIKNTIDENGIVKTKYCTSSNGITDRKNNKTKTVCCYPYQPGSIYPPTHSLHPQENNRPYIEQNKGHNEASSYTIRKKNAMLTDNGFGLRTSQGINMSNSIAYSVPTGGYIKNNGNQPFPVSCVPKGGFIKKEHELLRAQECIKKNSYQS